MWLFGIQIDVDSCWKLVLEEWGKPFLQDVRTLGIVACVCLLLGFLILRLLKKKKKINDTHILKLGVIGYSKENFDVAKAQDIVCAFFDKFSNQFNDFQVEVVSGLTYSGIPGIAYDEAQKRHWKTTGFACKKANDSVCFSCDNVYIIGEKWGDESEKFLDYIDALVKFGGGAQSEKEFNCYTGPKYEFAL